MAEQKQTPLKRLRKARGMTGATVAEAIGISNAQYSRIERGDPTSPETAEKLVEYFVGGITEMEILYPERYPEEIAA